MSAILHMTRAFFAYDKHLLVLIRRLEHDRPLAIEWFKSNYMNLN